MTPRLPKSVERGIWVIFTVIGVVVLYVLSLGPVLRLFDIAHAPAGYMSLPSAVRLFYYPLQQVPWPGFYCDYLDRVGLGRVHERYVPTEAERTAWPKTVDEAVTRLLAEMDDADKTGLRDTKKEDLILLHHGWGTGIRNDFGLWRGNTNLMADCHAQHPDDASMVIIKAVWQKLQKP
jgi:hypothetical protein